MASNMLGGGGAHSQSSLPSLPVHLQSDTHITAHLASRFHVSLPTAWLSSHALVSLNTYSSSAKGQDGTKDGSAMGGAEELAHRAFTRLGARSENQSVVFLGESGSGKTTIRSHLLSSLLSRSSTPLSQKLSLAAYVFDSLTTTKTATTPTASKAGLFYELQYDTASTVNPTLLGGKVLDHRLERGRVANVPTGERNFHVLYYLLAGTSGPEREHLGLDSPAGPSGTSAGHKPTGAQQKRWRYLGHPTQLKVGINDAEGFQLFKTALRKLEFPRGEIAEICQVMASILHLGQLEFESSEETTAAADDSGGFSHEGGHNITAIKNRDVLAIIAAFLGVAAQDLETTLGYKTKMLQKERVTIMLDPKGARANADELARTLYSLLVAYVIESINKRICAPESAVGNTISIVDFPGFAQQPATYSILDQLLTNAATESLYNFTLQSFFESKAEMLESEEVSIAATSYFDNSDAVRGLLKHGNGLLSILDDQSRRNRTDIQLLESLRKRFEGKNPAITVGSATTKLPGSNFATHNTSASFTVKHFAGEVDYLVTGLVEENGEVISGDLMNLISSTKSEFVGQLVGQEALQTVVHPQEKTTIMQAQVSSKPLRKPSVMRRKGARGAKLAPREVEQPADSDVSDVGDGESKSRKTRDNDQGASAQFLSSLDNVTKALTAPNSNPYFVFCLKPNDRRIANQFDNKCVRTQVQTFGIAEISQRLRNADFGLFLPFGEFLNLCEAETILVGSEREKAEMVLNDKRWPINEARVGSTGIFLSERCWAEIAKLSERGFTQARYPTTSDDGDMLSPHDLHTTYSNSKERLISPTGNTNSPASYGYGDKKSGYFGSNDIDSRSDAGVSALGQGDMFRNLNTKEQLAQRGNEKAMVEVEEVQTSGSRKRWVFIVYMLTWMIPDFLIRWIGRMPRKDVRMAWREKLAINLMIWFSCLFVAFFIVIFPELICPKQKVFSASELAGHDGKGTDAFVAIRGEVYDLGAFAPQHYPRIIPQKSLLAYAGLDATSLFPVQVSALCNGVSGQVNEFVTLDYTSTNMSGSPNVIGKSDTNSRFHDFRAFTGDSRKDWWWEQKLMLDANFKKGNIGYTAKYVHTLSTKQESIAIIHGKVYDFTKYIQGGRNVVPPPGGKVSGDVDVDFMHDLVVNLFEVKAGSDVTRYWDALPLEPAVRDRMQVCLNNLFYVGDVDTRNSVKCQFAQYLMLAVAILLCSVIGFKFFAALQFGTKNIPENLDKFVICQVPVYTEDEDSVRRAIDSAARMKYDDKRKLLVIICDGMIIGQGNDRPTPRIVLDILGVSDTVDPEPLSFESLGDGLKQHNMGKVYSGLYEVQGHIVPFMVIVKVGKPSEVSRPGNRGKRDSQMIIMRFLNRVHYNDAMSPLELEMYHQIRNIIGVNPAFYEFMFQIDADTVVAPDSASRMVSAFVDDTRLLGVCGETALSNAKSSFITMIQVYEYYISHNLSKAFESLFGSVTCLPGCFTMYRIRASDSGKPLFVSREIVDAYSTMRVDTLHTKNLLHLGEDRYLTTLLIKHHPKYKTKYIFSAHAWTIAPDTWKVFMSQRRRWINSTVHNLIELMPISQLCGFCCFSMRFVVFIDLLSTLVQPVIPVYIIYLIVIVALRTSVVPITAFILLGVIYGLQAIIFILRRKWEMVGWMILYILALPVFAFGLPLYSFWHMDDFSWGNTRIVTGEKGRKVVITDEGKFDPASIPHKKWEEYQAELWEAQTTLDDRSEVSGVSYGTKSFNAPVPEYNHYGARPMSMPLSLMPGANFPYDGNANPSRMSMAQSEMLGGNRQSQFGGSQFGQELEMSNLAGLPSDDSILAEIREILKTADLMNVTKKSIKQELERRFGVNLDARRTYINTATEALLSGQL